MSLIVMKFGGTSVGDIDRIKYVADKIIQIKNQGNHVAVVVSAMSGATDYLIGLGKQISDNPSKREMDMLVSTGEQVSTALLAMALEHSGVAAVSYNAMQIGIKTTSDYTRAKIVDIETRRINQAFEDGKVVVIAGFQGINADGDVTTLGRGGSDTTAVAIAAALNADRCDIYTDVDGVYTADPRIVKNARKLDIITHDEMLELASMGAKVLHDRSVIFAMKYGVPLKVLSTFVEGEGTMIVKEEQGIQKMEDLVITGITKKTNEFRINIANIPDHPGVAADIFKRLGEKNINVNMIVQSAGYEKTSQISFTALTEQKKEVEEVMNQIHQSMSTSQLSYDDGIAIISVVGIGMKAHSGVAAAVFDVFAENKMNIDIISTSEIKISVVIQEEYSDQAIRLLHERFFDAEKS